MSPREYTPGDTVFAKLKGYPWWPARVENDKDIPPKILKQKAKTKGVLYTVFFYGSRDYGFFGPDCVRPFDRETVERDLKAKKFKTKDLELAIHQALDPSILKAEEEAERLAAAAEEEEEEEEEEEDEEDEEEKPKRKTKAAAATKKKAPAKKRNNKRTVEEEEDEDMEEAPKRKTPPQKRASTQKNKRLADPESDTERKKRRKSLSMEQEDTEKVSRKSEEPILNHHNLGDINTVEDLNAFKKTMEFKKTYHLRHKLQKLVYDKKPGEIQQEDYAKISQAVKEIENATMSYDLLRYTKIGKVVKFASVYDYGEDEYNISQRCNQIMKTWKHLVLPENRTAEQHE